MQCQHHTLKVLIGAALAGATVTVHASGFRLPEVSITGLGTSNALVANAQEPGALAYNPAAMAFHDGTTVVGGLIAIDPNLSVTTASGNHDSDVDSPFYAPALFVTGHITPTVTWGLNINTPFGLETNWPIGTFPIGAASPTRSKIEMVNINPNIAFKIGANTSVAAGVDYYHVRDVRLDAVGAKIAGDGGDFGFNLAVLHTAGSWSFGGSYRSAITVDADGTATTVITAPATANVDFPWMLQIGARYQASKSLAIEFDIERTGWSSFDQIRITSAALLPTGQSTSTNNWDDANAYRLGATWDVTPETQLRFGYTFDETGQGDDHFSARVPDANRHLFSIGVAQKLGGWTIEGGYMYVLFDDRDYVSTTAYVPGGDANGTVAYKGNYEANVHLFGLGVSTKF